MSLASIALRGQPFEIPRGLGFRAAASKVEKGLTSGKLQERITAPARRPTVGETRAYLVIDNMNILTAPHIVVCSLRSIYTQTR